MDALTLHDPIGVFDAGIGSYAWVTAIRQKFPDQDLIYFADRANFPYGIKTKEELKMAITSAIERLAKLGAKLVIVASNAPSVVILNEIKDQCSVPVLGCYPPIQAGVQASKSKVIANLGVQSLLASPEFRFYIQNEAPEATVHLLDASSLVCLVENGAFLNQTETTQTAVTHFMQALLEKYPDVDVCTLSSTHLPWLIDFFVKAAPNIQFINPVAQTVQQIGPYISSGTGQTFCIATANDEYPLIGLQHMFEKLNLKVALSEV